MPRPFVAISLLLSLACIAGAAEPSPLVSPTSDVMLSLKVTAALQAHRSLKDFALTVEVVRGVATVGGEVPDSDCVSAIRTAVTQVPGVTSAKVTCWAPGGQKHLPASVPLHWRVLVVVQTGPAHVPVFH